MSPLQAQFKTWHVFEQWNKNEGLTSYVYKSSSAFDTDGNLYIVGGTLNLNNNYDWLITKYNALGEVIWIEQYDGSAGSDDYATDIYIDSNNTLYITGVVTVDTSQGWDLAMAIYDSSGTQQALDTYDGGQGYPYYDDGGVSIYVDEMNGYVYVGGGSGQIGTGTDFVLIQYDLSGNRQWVEYYDNAGGTDIVSDVYVDDMGFVFITGGTQTTSNGWKVKILEYDMSGSLQNISGTGSFQEDMDEIHFVNRDQYQNIYVTGYVNSLTEGKNLKTIAFDSTLALLWSDTLNSPDDMDDMGWGVYCDSMNHVYVGGYVTRAATGQDMVLIKYDTSGTRLWTKYYNGSDSLDDGIVGVTVDARGNVIVTGYSTIVGNKDFYTIKYDTSGAKVWEINYNSRANKDDHADGISIDAYGDIYVFGQSGDPGGGLPYTYKIVKYVERELYDIADPDTTVSDFDLTQNLGQVLTIDTVLNPNTSVLYYSTNPTTFFERNKIIQVLGSPDTVVSTTDTLVRLDMVLSADTTANLFALDKKNWYSNYYLPHTQSTKGLCRVPSYGKVYYPNIYSGVDVYSTANIKGLVHQFVIRPGESAKPSDITFSFDGADTVYIHSGNLVIVTSLDTIVYMAPECSQMDSSGGYVAPVTASVYTINGSGVVSFTDGSWTSSNFPIIVEMNQGSGSVSVLGGGGDNLDWSTYYGGAAYDVVTDIANDGINIFVCGGTFTIGLPQNPSTTVYLLGSNGIPGASSEAFYVKFDPIGRIAHRTYFGGSDYDMARGITVGKYIAIVGETSSPDLPNNSTDGINNTSLPGSVSGFIFAVTTTGQIAKCDSYIGGSTQDFCTAVSTSPVTGEKFVIVGRTNSTNFPTVSVGGAYNQAASASTFSGDGFVMRMDVNFNVTWSSTFGSDGDDYIVDARIDESGNIVVYGNTDETDLSATNNTYPNCDVPTDGSFPVCIRSGAYNQASAGGGGSDMFLAEFDASSELVWSSLFGTDGDEDTRFDDKYFGGGLDVDANSNIYITGGIKGSASGITFTDLSANSYSQTAYISPQIAFISKLENRDIAWYTLYGGNVTSVSGTEHTMGMDIDVDGQGYIFVTGGMQMGDIQSMGNYCTDATGGEFPICNQSGYGYLETDNHSGGAVAFRTFVVGFNELGEIAWSTRYGNGTSNWATGITTTNDNKVYITGIASQNSSYTYTLRELIPCPAAYCNEDWFDPTYNGGTGDGVVARFSGSLVLSVEEFGLTNGLTVFPNPTSNFCNIVSKDNEQVFDNVTVYVFDISGKMIACPLEKSQNIIKVDMQRLIPGIYIIKVINSGAASVYKVIKT